MKSHPKRINKGIILAGGSGTRLRPATLTLNKHLIPIINFPMILYPLNTLRELGVTDVLIVSGGDHIGGFAEFLGDGGADGVRLTYKVQSSPDGIAGALRLAEDFVRDEELFAVILGDNFFDQGFGLAVRDQIDGPMLFLTKVDDPQRFGVYIEDEHRIIEKPKDRVGPAVTGLYIYDKEVFEIAATLSKSERGEFEITDVNNNYLENPETSLFEFEYYWSDMGTPDSIVRTIKHLAEEPFSPRPQITQ